MKKQKKNKSNLKVKIISGAWKGRNISFLEKRDLRPTKNQIREPKIYSFKQAKKLFWKN